MQKLPLAVLRGQASGLLFERQAETELISQEERLPFCLK